MWYEDSPAYNIVNTDLFQLLQDDIDYFEPEGAVFIVGDYNARVGNGDKKDYIVCDTVISGIDQDGYESDTPLARHSLDNLCNAQGTKLLDLCKATSMRIANGRLGEDRMKGSFTFTCGNGSSVIDYLLLQEKDFHRIRSF